MDLKLDISSLKQEPQASTISTYDGKLTFPDDTIKECSINSNIKIMNVEEGLYLSGSIDVVLRLLCSRCIETFNYKSNIKIDELCSFSETDPFESYISDDDILDLQELLRQRIILSIPVKPLCFPECMGLCHECGIDLNKKHCDCHNPAADPLWTKLKDDFNKLKGG